MCDFSWMNEIPDAEWDKHGNGFRKSFDLEWFLQKSNAVGFDRWREEIDIWGASQPRRYGQFESPPAYDGRAVAFIVCGDWADGKNGVRCTF